jgi:hypothetical protein
MPSPGQIVGPRAWLDFPAYIYIWYEKCCSYSWKLPSGTPKTAKKQEPHRDPPDDSDDGGQILNDNEQWLKEALKKKAIQDEKTTLNIRHKDRSSGDTEKNQKNDNSKKPRKTSGWKYHSKRLS